MSVCTICNTTKIPEVIFDILDWDAERDNDQVICHTCAENLVKNKEAKVEILVTKKAAVLARITWGWTDEEDSGHDDNR